MQHPNVHANYISVLRHTCSAKDGMAGWGWTSYDSRTGGSQTMHDVGNGLDLTTEFVKTNSKDNAGNWALRISGTPRKNERAGIKTEVVFYVGMEGMQNCFNCELVAAAEEQGSGNNKFIENVDIKIRHPGLGNAMIHIPNPRGQEREARKHRTVVHQYTGLKSINVTEDILWQSNRKQTPVFRFQNQVVCLGISLHISKVGFIMFISPCSLKLICCLRNSHISENTANGRHSLPEEEHISTERARYWQYAFCATSVPRQLRG